MATENKTKAEIIKENIQKEISKIDNKECKFYFFTLDTKGKPNSELTYLYETALAIQELGYNVEILHAEKDFVGVEAWLGKKYSSLPHSNIETDGVRISPSDFLIIPEIFSNVMFQTKKLPCKRVILLHNFNYLTEVIQPGVSWEDYGIDICITSSEMLKRKVSELFKKLNVNVVKPFIDSSFKKDARPKKLIVNIVTKDRSIVNRIVKEFFWKYPTYKWVAFRHVMDIPRDEFADVLKESFATIWVDETASFGYSALEAISAGSVLLAKIPQDVCDWAIGKDGVLRDNAIWFDNISQVHSLVAQLVEMFIHSDIPVVIADEMEITANEYGSREKFIKEVENTYINELLENRKKEFTQLLALTKEND